MRTQEWTYADRSGWSAGPWDSEPDKRQWVDEATGLPCLIVRQKSTGHLCGYVGVAKGHPYYQMDEVAAYDLPLDVHFGITFARMCMEEGGENDSTVCHVDPDDDDRFWLGFDMAHYQDVSPGRIGTSFSGSTYKTFGYVEAECVKLAAQLVEALR